MLESGVKRNFPPAPPVLEGLWAAASGKTNRNILKQYGILKMYNLQKE